MKMLTNSGRYACAFAMTVALGALTQGVATAAVTEIAGAGATFPYPVYAKWAEAYAAKTGIKLNYQSIGSGGGYQADRGEDRRLRCVRRTAQARRTA